MSRRRFALSDEQARILVRELAPILERFPDAGGRDHRPFLREFLRAVHHATGATFSPTIYQRLLDAFVPGRHPSSNTLEAEKQALVLELESEIAGSFHHGVQPAGLNKAELEVIIRRAVDGALMQHGKSEGGAGVDRVFKDQMEQLQSQLLASDRQLNEAKATAARLAGELQAAFAIRDALQCRVDADHAMLKHTSASIDALSREVAGMRSFALTAIDGVRGETRAWQDRYIALEARLTTTKQTLEYFRQAAYQRGATIPHNLLPEGR